MLALKRLKRRLRAVTGGVMLAFTVVVAGLLGLASAVIPFGFGILALEINRFKRWVRSAQRI